MLSYLLKLRINGRLRSLFSSYAASFSSSSSTTPSIMAEYLVNTLGFSNNQALITSSKVSHLKSTKNPDSVVGFFQGCGFSKTQIKCLLVGAPIILSYNVDKTLKPKIKAFQDFGFCDSDIAHVIAAQPYALLGGLDSVILPALGILKSIFNERGSIDVNDYVIDDGDSDVGKNLSLIKALKKSSWWLAPNLSKELPLIVSLLQSYGLSLERILYLLVRKPRYFSMSLKRWKAVLVRVEKLGIPRQSPMFFHGMYVLSCSREETVKMKVDLCRGYGFSELDLMKLIRNNPYALSKSEAKLRSCINFYTKELGIDPSGIASRAFLLNLSLEKRVLPRYMVLKGMKEKGLKINSSTIKCLAMAELEFLRKYVEPLKDKDPDLYDAYMKIAHPPKKAAKVDKSDQVDK